MITIKIGGSVVDNLHPSTIADIKKIAQTEGVIIVHGGGKEVTKVCEQLGKEPKFVTSPSGIKSRYTDKETVEIFTMVMSGRINKTIVQMLQKNGINAIGLSGVDGKIIQAERKKTLLIINDKGRKQAIDGGYTGKITNVNADFIKSLLDQGMTPVISPIAISEECDFLNIDGDRAAAYVAGSVGADKVLFITNVDGLLMDDKLVTNLTLSQAKEIRPKIGPGMEKKILASTEALDMGVKEAIIANGQKENPISSAISHNNCTVIKHD
ncbi:MAG: [Nitrosarchaeum sp.]|jgi:acetylglutamate/LysW-gamma-L-alpha-aminoadipate kinase|nr:[LysW]-aminoadipate/[LysW]-glutamate kinase [Nitrosarchaeum sp.]MBP0119753.1 [LysW]-aminoadipate/[LysW]-glutamate kinase [Nitrosarchaeum sp.]MBP0134250.1 [LysW]-aminoadipate/[LysW]-glutamate kinase [Nitrosarchaeum sp.]MSV26310.1 [LysW]-aminoadipate/[LysW]-glutamate kinase [Nitrosarchaeum sp.]PHY08622.1 MAG: acetylglutamate kinase [Nitrosarchaeum sp.]